MNPLTFCNFADQQFDAICNLLCNAFNISNSELLNFYEKLRAGFDQADWPPPIFANRNFFSSQDKQFQSIYNCAPAIAWDLPSLLSKGGQNTIMLIAQDPYNKNPAQGAWIGTPYALHTKKCREQKHTRRYLQLIDVLLQRGYQVYLTDIYKIYVHEAKLPRKDRQRFSEILKQEIEIIKPAAVITWGNQASRAVSRLKLGTSHFSYPHPSGNARGAWARRIGDRATDKKILDYWRSSITHELERTAV